LPITNITQEEARILLLLKHLVETRAQYVKPKHLKPTDDYVKLHYPKLKDEINRQIESSVRRLFIQQVYRLGVEERPVCEVVFHPRRKWRFDLLYPRKKIAVEIHGGRYLKKGGHNTPGGLLKDWEKINEGQNQGFDVYQFASDQIQINDQSAQSFVRYYNAKKT